MTEQEVIYRFTPHQYGEFLQGVPKRDLTQVDVNRMTGQERADAFSPHPLNGETLYTPTEEYAEVLRVRNEERAKAAELAEATPGAIVEFIEGSIVIDRTHPKWFQARQEKAAEEHILLAPPLPDETAKAYDERMEAALSDGDSDPDQDGAE